MKLIGRGTNSTGVEWTVFIDGFNFLVMTLGTVAVYQTYDRSDAFATALGSTPVLEEDAEVV